MIPQNIIPIHWFGDRKAYEKSALRVVTVGLNPSDREFRKNDSQPFTAGLRFPLYQKENPNTLASALNAYFEENPYRSWFNMFESILNGMGASYYSDKGISNRAIHTDICSPWATDPTWGKLLEEERTALCKEGNVLWEKLMVELKPNILIASIDERNFASMVDLNTRRLLHKYTQKKDGSVRKRKVEVMMYDFNGIPFINGTAQIRPFGGLCEEERIKLGEEIKKTLF